MPLSLIGPAAFAQATGGGQTKPATQNDLNIYFGMGTSFLCDAIARDIEFPKAAGMAVGTPLAAFNALNGGELKGISKKMPEEKAIQMFKTEIFLKATQTCPEGLPKEIKDRGEEIKKVLLERNKKMKK